MESPIILLAAIIWFLIADHPQVDGDGRVDVVDLEDAGLARALEHHVGRKDVLAAADVRVASLGARGGGVAGLVGLVVGLDPEARDAVLVLEASRRRPGRTAAGSRTSPSYSVKPAWDRRGTPGRCSAAAAGERVLQRHQRLLADAAVVPGRGRDAGAAVAGSPGVRWERAGVHLVAPAGPSAGSDGAPGSPRRPSRSRHRWWRCCRRCSRRPRFRCARPSSRVPSLRLLPRLLPRHRRASGLGAGRREDQCGQQRAENGAHVGEYSPRKARSNIGRLPELSVCRWADEPAAPPG